jgi:hypothetical protein
VLAAATIQAGVSEIPRYKTLPCLTRMSSECMTSSIEVVQSHQSAIREKKRSAVSAETASKRPHRITKIYKDKSRVSKRWRM